MNTVRGLLYSGLFVIIMTLVGVWLSNEARARAPAAPAAIAGSWTLNKDLSDKAPDGMRPGEDEAGRRRGGNGAGGGFGRGGGMGRGGGLGRGGGMNPEATRRIRDAMRDIMTPPDRLTVVETDSMIVITAGDGRVTRLSPDGAKIKDDNTRVERRTKWDGAKLVSEVSGLGRGKITETYSVDPEHRQLVVTIAMENPRSSQPMSERRVYDAEAR